MDGETVPSYVEVEVALPEGPFRRSARGKLDAAHLADHPAAAVALWAALRPGARLEGLLVLQRLEVGGQGRKVTELGVVWCGVVLMPMMGLVHSLGRCSMMQI